MIENIFVIGFHHSSLTSVERGEILLQNDINKTEICLSQLQDYGVKSASLLKTCNRIELYGYGNARGAKALFYDLLKLDPKFRNRHTLKVGVEGLHHIFKVASGLDSQLLGDQEIVSQFKQSIRNAKSLNLLDGFMERLANTCLQASKQVRKKTKLTIGTTSLSYAAIQILKQKKLSEEAKILIVGLGKFGSSIAKNIKKYFPFNPLILTNRTITKSINLSKELSCEIIELSQAASCINDFDVVICAVELQNKLLKADHYRKKAEQIIIDLSVPSPIDSSVHELKGIDYYSIDEATNIVNNTWKERRKSIVPALEIIDEFKEEFIAWSRTYRYSGVIKEWKSKLEQTAEVCPFFATMESEEKHYYMKKSMGQFVKFLKEEPKHEADDNLIHTYLKSH